MTFEPPCTPEVLFQLERNMIPHEEWGRAPAEARRIAEEELAQRIPTGIAHSEKYGWVVIQSSGQGPYLIWSERGSIYYVL